MTKKTFLTIKMMLLFVLAMSNNTAMAGVTVGGPSDWYYVNFETRVSTPSCGNTVPGLVKLNYTDNSGNPDNPRLSDPEPTVPEEYADYSWAWEAGVGEGKSDATTQDTYDDDYATRNWGWTGEEETILKGNAAASAGYKAGFDWYKAGRWLNSFTGDDENNYATDWGTSASLNGYAMVHIADMDLDLMSSYAYFEAKVRENDGWYFTGWSYAEGESDLGGHVDTDTEEDKGYLFKIFPSDLQGWNNKSKVYAYATFKPVMVSDYKVTGLINGTGNSTTVIFDAVGERVSASDFTVSVPDANFSAEITSCDANKVTVTVTYSGSTNGEFRGNVTLASKSGCSQLTAPVYARVGEDAMNEATLYDGKTPTEQSGTLLNMIAEANNTDKIVVLNKNYTENLTINANVTLNFNGYTIKDLTVAGGEVTIAYDKYGSNGAAVSVKGGKLVLNGGTFGTLTIGANGTVEQNGATFTGAANNEGTLVTNEGLFNAGLTSSNILTVNNGTFKGETAITISGGTAVINRGTIKGTACGLKVTAGTATVKKLAAIKGGTYSAQQTGGTLTIECGKFDGALSGTIDFTSGYFKDKAHAESVETGKDWMQLTNGVEYNEGYRFFLGNSETGKTNGVGVCSIGDVSYATLEAALAYANNKPNEELVIFMTNNYTLPAGYYTLPAKATLVVPMSDTQAKINLTAPRLVYNDVNNAETDMYTNNIPSEFRRLTFAKGVNMDVFGKIELTCTQYQSNEAYTSQPVGAYGHLVMEEGSHMTLQSGSELRAWGFMTGKGETDARRGAVVREMFQMGDWKGAMTSVAITGMVAGTGMEGIVKSAIGGADSGDFSDKKIFPVSQYFIQNVESPVKYHPGALLSTSAAVSEGVMGMSISMAATDIAIVGVSNEHTAIFLMDIAADAENTWVRKWYDAENDIQVYDINSGAHIGSMELDMGGLNLMGFSIPVKLNSAKFDLPITSNMKIHLLTGGMDFEQNTSLLPGAEVEVDKESTVSISMNEEDKVAKAAGTADHVYHSGAVYVYDQNEWDTYAYNTKYTKVVRYTPSASNGEGGQPNVRNEDSKPASAKINVHGTFNTKDGYVYTSASGANIFSSNEDAGTFIFNNAGGEAGERDVYQIRGKGNRNAHYVTTPFTCAQLRNSDDSYTETGSALPGFAFIYRDGKWQEPITQTETDMIVTYNSNCFAADISMMTYLAQVCDINPSNLMASPMKEDVKNQIATIHAPLRIREYLLADAFAKANGFDTGILPHEYEYFRTNYYAAVAALGKEDGEAFMKAKMQNSGDPQQQAAANLVPLIPGFKTQAEEYNETYDLGSAVQKLMIKPQEWVEIAGTVHAQLDVDYGTIDEYEESYVNAIEAVQNNNYTACDDIVNEYLDYIESQRMNPVIVSVDGNADNTYSDADGAGRLFIRVGDDCQWWEVEKKDNLYHCIHPNNDTYYYWDEDEGGWVEKKFTITWINWDKTPVITKDMDGNDATSYDVPYGTVAEFFGTNPTREATNDYTYDFTGWSPALDSVKSDVTYTATYTQKPRTYTIIFLNEGGVEIERQFLTLNEWPVCENTPTKIGHTLEWTPAIAAVTGEATYTAKWLEEPPTEYEITFFDYDGTTKLKPADETPYMVAVGVVPTPPADPIGKPATGEFTYVFDHWAPALEEVSATSPKSYTAVYREEAKKYTVIFQNEDGSEIERHEYSYGETPVCSATPTKENTPEWTYQLIWDPQIQTVMGDATYKADFETLKQKNKYTVTLKANPSGACTFSGAGTFDYSEASDAITIGFTANPGYTFTGWSDESTESSRSMALTGDINLVANFDYEGEAKTYTINWSKEDGTLIKSVAQVEGTATTYTGATPTKAATAQNTFTFYGWSTAANGGGTIYKNGMTPKATANATYYAYFKQEARKYTISWKNEAGTADIEVDYNQPYDAVIEYNSATPTKHATAQYTYTFDGWSTSVRGDVAALPAKVKDNAAFYAHFAATTNTYTITWLRDDGSLIDRTEVAYGEVPTHADPTKAATPEYTYTFTDWDVEPVAVTGIATYTALFSSTPVLTAGIGVTVEAEAKAYASITITSNGVSSGQITNADAITSCGDAYFDLAINAQAETWYAVAVPWQVSVADGIFVNGVKQSVNSNFYLLTYNSEDRATNGASSSNWTFENNTCIMQPGTLYMIYMVNGAKTIRFKKQADADISTTELSVQPHTSKTGSDIDAGWNGIANPALYHAYLNAQAETYGTANFGQKYKPVDDSYDPIDMKNNKLIVGQPIFVQVKDPKTVVAETTNSSFAAHAPRRAPRVDNAYYEVQISAGETYTDRLYLQTLEDKEDRYIIGLDLAKAGVSNKVAQMWVNRYNAKLCVNTTAPVGKTATYPLGISVPENGTYQISSATEMQNNQELYVTRNGKAIWNLAYGPYTVTLDKGTYSEYGIKLIQSNAPAVTTGVDQTTTDKLQIQKVLIDNKVYIVREGELYTITGQKVK